MQALAEAEMPAPAVDFEAVRVGELRFVRLAEPLRSNMNGVAAGKHRRRGCMAVPAACGLVRLPHARPVSAGAVPLGLPRCHRAVDVRGAFDVDLIRRVGLRRRPSGRRVAGHPDGALDHYGLAAVDQPARVCTAPQVPAPDGAERHLLWRSVNAGG